MKKIIAFMLLTVMAVTLFAGCTKKEDTGATTTGTTAAAKKVDVKDIFKKAEDKIGKEEIAANQDADAEMLETYYGIKEDLLDAYVLKFPLINVKAEEVFIAKVKDGKMEEVKKGIEQRKTALDEQWKQYLPDQYELVKNGKIFENGNYIMYVVTLSLESSILISSSVLKQSPPTI